MAARCSLIIFLCFTCGLLTAGAASIEDNVAITVVSLQVLSCPEGWVEFASRCFKFFSTKKIWMDAEKACIDIGGNLASVHSSEENTFIINLIKEGSGASPHTWIGGHDGVQEGSWMWSDGSKFDYTHWRVGEPNNSGSVENCLVVNYEGDLWNDAPCRRFYEYVCSRDPSQTTLTV